MPYAESIARFSLVGVVIFIRKGNLGLKMPKTKGIVVVVSYCRKFGELWTTQGQWEGRRKRREEEAEREGEWGEEDQEGQGEQGNSART